jgi:hypothetical protein
MLKSTVDGRCALSVLSFPLCDMLMMSVDQHWDSTQHAALLLSSTLRRVFGVVTQQAA